MSKIPFEFQREYDGTLSLESAIFQAIGAASVCWEETPTGVFNSTLAKEVGERLVKAITEGELDNIEVLSYAPNR